MNVVDDSDLHTGFQPSLGNEEQPHAVNEEIEQQRAEVAALLPSVDSIINTINEERKAVSDIRSYLSQPRPLWKVWGKDDIQAEFRARELYMGYLDRLETAIEAKVGNYREVE